MAVAQLNVRLDQGLKQEGDAVLASIGLSSTAFIKGMWEFLALHAAEPAKAKRQLAEIMPIDPDAQALRRKRIAAAEAGCRMWGDFAKQHGADPSISDELVHAESNDDLRRLLYEELAERYEG